MVKTFMASTAMAVTLLTTPALAQTVPPPPVATTPQAGQIDVQKLIGRSVTNVENETVGEIESVILDAEGKARAAIVGVGGFLGMGERHVAVGWDRLTVSPAGEKILISATKDELKALAPYSYAEAKQRRTVFVEAPMSGGAVPSTLAPGSMPVATSGPLNGSDLIGLDVRNTANATIGEIKDIVVSADGKVTTVIVGIGGFLGLGERYVSMPWDQLTLGRNDDNGVVARISATKEQLMSMPAVRRDKSLWIRG